MCNFANKPENVQFRLAGTLTLVLTSVAYKLMLSNSLPTISYLTLVVSLVTILESFPLHIAHSNPPPTKLIWRWLEEWWLCLGRVRSVLSVYVDISGGGICCSSHSVQTLQLLFGARGTHPPRLPTGHHDHGCPSCHPHPVESLIWIIRLPQGHSLFTTYAYLNTALFCLFETKTNSISGYLKTCDEVLPF